MAALSISSVTIQAKEDVSQHLKLVQNRKDNTFSWIYDDGKGYSNHVVPVAKIRDIKMAEWMDHARTCLGNVKEAIARGEALPKPAPEQPAMLNEPMPSFMLVSKKAALVPFEKDPELQGEKDARRGITACPYGLDWEREKWNRGHDRVYDSGEAEKPRFGRLAGRRN